MSAAPQTRIRIISVLILAVALVIIVKLYIVQIVRHDDFVLSADRQYSKPNNAIFNRGSIFFETKDGKLISAATLKSGFTLTINPKILVNAEEAYEKLSKIVEIDRDDFFAKAAKKDDPYEEIAKRVPEDKGKEIEALKIAGVRIYKEQWRFYPGGEEAAQTLGFVAFKGDELSGRYGLERFYEDVLSRSGSDMYANFFVEIFSNIKKTVSDDEDFEGDIVTTIEPVVQAHLAESVVKIQERWSSESSGGIIMDPKTGEILAMTQVPAFDPNNFSKEKNVAIFGNPLVEEVHEMGSIVKPLTVAAGLDQKVISANTTYFDAGSVTLNTETIYNFDLKGRGQIPMQIALNKSLNTGMVFIFQKLGKEIFRKYMLDFGLGEKTGIDLPNEAQNIVTNLKSPRDIEYATASFGQGIALTPISIARALSTLGNGGMLVVPHIVKRINY
ncbi:MAG TPA: penicillin-binding protein 2, partial [Candidatus Paceibacterota bacterium]|nr:penicillin-binding protein 2 [Candidatus Paceibacterota bacterium]